jgi:hypothetical protein
VTLSRAEGDLAGAKRHYQQALDRARASGSPFDEASALAGLGHCAQAAGNTAIAAGLLGQARQLFHRSGAGNADALIAEIGDPAPAEPAR